MKRCIITLPSMTFTQKAQAILRENSVEASVIKLPPTLAEKGCGWGIRLNCDQISNALHVLSVSDLPYKKVYTEEL